MATKTQITLKQYFDFIRDFENGLFKHQRCGQAFMNKFDIKNDQKLFYAISKGGALKIIQKNYVKSE